jgi:UDPglucose--hexose-1-phosphate uridylyltransferase
MELRLNSITGEPVLFATNRVKRPHYGRSSIAQKTTAMLEGERPATAGDPFAPGQEALTGPELWAISDDPNRTIDDPSWKVRVIKNRYPILPIHEVIILSPHARHDIGQMSHVQAERIVQAFLVRAKEHQKSGYVYLFCNHGPDAGTSLTHPHAQLIVFPTIPPVVQEKMTIVQRYFDQHGTCLYCDLLVKEQKHRRRLVWENEEYALICPESSGWPFQLLLMPKIHQGAFTQLKELQIKPFAQALQVMNRLYANVLDRPSYNFWIHSARGSFFHWHLEMIPRQKILAGIELGGGIMVNDRILPEDAAAVFRAALKSLKA